MSELDTRIYFFDGKLYKGAGTISLVDRSEEDDSGAAAVTALGAAVAIATALMF